MTMTYPQANHASYIFIILKLPYVCIIPHQNARHTFILFKLHQIYYWEYYQVKFLVFLQ